MDAQRASMLSEALLTLIQEYSSNRNVKPFSRICDYNDGRNAMGSLLETLFDAKVLATLKPVFSGKVINTSESEKLLPGAVLFGRLFAYVVRMKTLNRLDSSGAAIPFHASLVSYADLNTTPKYMADVAADITYGSKSKEQILASIKAEVYHFSRGVEAFYRGVATVHGDTTGENFVYFVADLVGVRDKHFCLSEDDASSSVLRKHKQYFNFHPVSDQREVGQPPRINKLDSDGSVQVLRLYATQHLLSIKAFADDNIGAGSSSSAIEHPQRKRPMQPTRPVAGPSKKTKQEIDDEEAQANRVAMRLRAPAATQMTTPHSITTISVGDVSRYDIFNETALSDSTYDRYTIEQRRLHRRLDLLRPEMQPYVHGMTMRLTQSNSKNIETLISELKRDVLSVDYSQAERQLLRLYMTNKTVPIYINPSVHLTERRRLSWPENDPDDPHHSNYEDMERVFREVRRCTTLMFLLSHPADTDLKQAKGRIPENSSFLKFINAGKDNSSFVFNAFKEDFKKDDRKNKDAYDSSNVPGVPFTRDMARKMCKRMNPIPNVKVDEDETADDARIDRALIRVNKMWDTGGLTNAEDAARVVSQYAYGSENNVGVTTAGAFVFRSGALYDEVEVARWNLLYSVEQVPSTPPVEIEQFKDYLAKYCEAVQRTSPRSFSDDLELKACKGWWDELFNFQFDKDLEELVKEMIEAPLKSTETFARNDVYDAILKLSPKHYEANTARLIGDELDLYNKIHTFRLWRRDSVLQRSPPTSSPDHGWFLDTFGVTVSGFSVRKELCGAAYPAVAIPKKGPNKSKFAARREYGVMMFNERMLTEFGERKDGPDKDTVLNSLTKIDGGVDGLSLAGAQLSDTMPKMDALWMLLARMSSVGILNVDCHLGNYMLTSYDNGSSYECKVIDFDGNLSTVFSSTDMTVDEMDPNKEGWKPLYILNSLLLMFTLSQDTSRNKLYELFKNAGRPVKSASAQFANALSTSRMGQFTDMVNETMRAIKNTPEAKQSVPQKLLATSWGGGYKGDGNEESLKLPLAFFVNDKVTEAFFDMAYYQNAYKAWKASTKTTPPEKPRPIYDRYINQLNTTSTEKSISMEESHKVILKARRQETDTFVKKLRLPPISLQEYADALKIIMKLDVEDQFSRRAAPKVPQPGASHLKQMQWALRTNLSWRGFNELSFQTHHHWTIRQGIINEALFKMIQAGQSGGIDPTKADGSPLTASEEMAIIPHIPPQKKQAYYNSNAFFTGDYKLSFAASMHHMTRIRPTGYTVIDMLYEYIYTQAPLRPIGPGKDAANLRPRFPPPFQTQSARDVPKWEEWPVYLPDDNRGVLSVLPMTIAAPPEPAPPVPTGGDEPAAMEE